jgi:spermidine/putrescine transport system permease protein
MLLLRDTTLSYQKLRGIFMPIAGRLYGMLPSVKPGIIAGCILVFVPSLGAFLAPDLLGGAKHFMIGSLIEEQFKGNAGNWPFGAATSMILLTLVLIVLMAYARQQSRTESKYS